MWYYTGDCVLTPIENWLMDKKNIKHDIKGNIFYFPTRLRGNNYRYGPYQDCPDYLYLSWQKSLIEIWKRKFLVCIAT